MNSPSALRRSAKLAALVAALALATGCPPARSPGSDRSEIAQKWFERTQKALAEADVDEAWDAAKSAVEAAPTDVETRLLAGRVALARMDWPGALKVLEGVDGTEARGLRGRARWYAGEIDLAADELEAMLRDPEVHDGWAKAIAGLARRGAGRSPFAITGGIVAAVEMPHVLGTSLVVPLEIDGEQALALVATGTAEVTLDNATRKDPSWVNLRFGGSLEVKDVPAVVQDLSAISKQMNAPIKALLGVNFLRRANVTFDFSGGQFVVRAFAPPPPPSATKLPLAYLRGGGMVVRTTLRPEKDALAAVLLVDTSISYPVSLDEGGWKKAGLGLDKLSPVTGDAKLRQGKVPALHLGAFEIPDVPGVEGVSIADVEKGVSTDLDGVLGSGVLAAFRATFTEGGRALWLEDLPSAPEPSKEAAPVDAPPAASSAEPAKPPPPAKKPKKKGAGGPPGVR